jgi:spermidine synthase
MKNWKLVGEAAIPDSDHMLRLFQGKDDFFIKISNVSGELMSTRKHGSEDALGKLPCERVDNRESARVLIGGLGMGFTLTAALNAVGESAEVTVAELIPEVVEWNQGPLGKYAGHPMSDPRTKVYVGDVARLLKKKHGYYDVIALDVDNGPEGITKSANDWIYSSQGIISAQKALTPNGILAYWSAGPDQDFHDLLRCCGFMVDEVVVFAHGNKGARHTIWICTQS